MYTVLLILSFLMFGLSLWAQHKVSSTIKQNHNSQILNGLTGAEVAKLILEQNQISNVPVIQTAGTLTDNYNPLSREVSLSTLIYRNNSISSAAVAAHEVGHALQHHNKYPFLVLRTAMYPVVSFSSKAFPVLLIASLIFQFTELGLLAIGFYAVSVLFSVVTLPVEFDASKRALVQLKQLNLVTEQELPQVKKVLNAAALTYVAAALISIVELLRFIMYFKSE